MLGTVPKNLSMQQNSTVAFAQAFAAFDLGSGDVILTSRADYASNQIMYLALAKRRGVEIVRAPDAPEGGIDLQAVRELLAKKRPALVSLTWIPTNSGLVQPAEKVGELCRDAGVPYIVDACQAVGQMPVEVGRLHCDYLAGAARKFLRGPRGVGFLYVADRALEAGAYPLTVDMHGATWNDPGEFELTPDARRFESWEIAYALVLERGPRRSTRSRSAPRRPRERSWALARYAREQLAKIEGVRVLDRGPAALRHRHRRAGRPAGGAGQAGAARARNQHQLARARRRGDRHGREGSRIRAADLAALLQLRRRDRQRRGGAGGGDEDDRAYDPRFTRGSSTFHTVSAMRCCPSAVGWIMSGWLSSERPATPSRRKGTSATSFSLARSDRPGRSPGSSRGRRFGGTRIPRRTMAGLGDCALARSIIAWMLERNESTSRPRSPSLAPVSITRTATGSRSSHSILRRVPADVSPLTPAFTASNRMSAGIQLPLNQRRVRLIRIESQPRGEA